MFIRIICMFLFVDSVVSRNVPNFEDLDEDDQMLFRAAYDTPYSDAPSYHNQDAYKPQPYPVDYSKEIPASKLDLLKDGMWALKAKMKELKAFNKALAANLLATKLKVKEVLKKLQHEHVEVDKPAYTYQPPTPSYAQHQPGYTAPQYTAPQYTGPQYTGPQYSTPATAPQYHHYGGPQPYDPYHGQ